MSSLATATVGIVVERRKSNNQWVDFLWLPVAALPGVPDVTPWSVLEGDDTVTRFYAGAHDVGLYRSDTAQYRENLASGAPSLWVVLRATGGDPAYTVFKVTANPSEGEAFTEAGNDLVEPVPMPESIQDWLAAFIVEHHVEETFEKRKRVRADPEALARRSVTDTKR